MKTKMEFSLSISENLKNTNIITKGNILEYKTEPNYFFSTGSKNFDKVLNGGFQSSHMYLIFGANKTGKTQISHQMCLQAFKQNYKTIYIDAENTFRPERIKELATAFSLDYTLVLKSILVTKIMSTSALLLKLNEIERILEKNEEIIIVIDSINNHFRVELGEKLESFLQIKNKFLKTLEKLNNLTKRFNLITIATAQVSPNFIENSIIREYPVGLRFLNQYFSEFIYLSYKEKDSGYVHLINSIKYPEKKILYRISNIGIEDYKI
jgi:RecA/RadA recombinase